MKTKTAFTPRALAGAIITALTLSLGACVYDPYYYGPPPPAQFHPDPYDYYYYPYSNVYFHFSTGLYWYLDNGVWISARVLPPRIYISSRYRYRINVKSEKPWLKNKEFERTYRRDPRYRPNPENNQRERDANRQWYDRYRQQQDDRDRRPTQRDSRDRDRDRPFGR